MTHRNSLMSSAGVKSVALGLAIAGLATQVEAATASFNGGVANPVTIATAAATASGGLVSFANDATATSRSIRITPTAGATFGAGQVFNVTLPSGYTWVGTPSCSGFNPAADATLGCQVTNAPNGTNLLTILVATTGGANDAIAIGLAPNLAAAKKITVNNGAAAVNAAGTGQTAIAFNAGSSLNTPTANGVTFPVRVVSGGAGAGTDAPAAGTVVAASVQLINAALPVQATIAPQTGTPQIDVGTASAAKLFVASSANNRTTRTAQQGTATFGAVGTIDSTGNPYTLTGAALALTVSGVFNGISRSYLSQANCVTTAGGGLDTTAVTGVVAASGTSVTFSGLNTTAGYNLCIENDGTSLLYEANYTASPSLNGSAFPTVGAATAIGSLAYNGQRGTINYVTGGSAYQFFVRAVNTSSTTSGLVFVAVTTDAGVTQAGYLSTALGANANALFSVDQLNSATGLNLTANDRARVLVITQPNGNSASNGILFNTATGVVNNIQ